MDPVDGTREFSDALWEREEISAPAVALPAQGKTLSTAQPPTPPQAHCGRVRLLVSRTRQPQWIEPIRRDLGATVVPMRSAGAKAMAVMQGKGDAYLHSGGQYE